MCKNGLKKYMLLKKEDGEVVSIYRVLELVEEKVLVMDCMKKVMPVWKSIEELDAYVEVEEDINTDTLSTLEDMDAEDRKIAYQRYRTYRNAKTLEGSTEVSYEEGQAKIQSIRETYQKADFKEMNEETIIATLKAYR